MADENTPAPVAPAEPVAPVTPAVTPPAPEAPKTPTPEEAAQIAEDKEWDDAQDELFPGLKGQKKETKKDEPTVTTTTTQAEETTTTTTIDPNETPEQKAEREAKEAADAKKASEENEEPDTSARDTRLAAREAQQQTEAVKADVRKQMFADIPTELRDHDGDPIRGIEDVMKLINPRTVNSEEFPNGRAFTEEEAGMWLLSAQQQFNQNIAQVDKQIEQIAEVNIDLKDQADSVSYEYGELLKAMPELRDQIWAEFEKTLVKDEKSGIITKAPVSLERFYKIALQPYAKLAQNLETEEAAKQAAEAKAAEEAKKKNERADRSDIFGGGNTDTTDPEDKEWNDAAVTVFGPRKQTK